MCCIMAGMVIIKPKCGWRGVDRRSNTVLALCELLIHCLGNRWKIPHNRNRSDDRSSLVGFIILAGRAYCISGADPGRAHIPDGSRQLSK